MARRGPPRKVFTESNFPREIHTTIPNHVFQLLPEGTINSVLEALITAAYGDKEKRELEEQRKKVSDLEIELSRERVRLAEIEKSVREKEQMEEALKKQDRYMAHAFRRIVREARSYGRITMKPEWISRIYGISMDVKKVNRDLEASGGKIAALLSRHDYELVENYGITKEQRGKMEPELVREMEAEESA